jgi:multiple sugar transport system substrate-binding protein
MKLTNLFAGRSNGLFFLIGAVSVLILLIFYFAIPFSKDFIDSEKEIVITYADNISTAHMVVIDKFNEEYKGRIKVKPIDLPFTKFSTNERKELLARSLRSKSDKLDIFAIDLIWSARFARWAHSLDSYFSKSDLQNILPTSLFTCYYKDSLIALPIYVDIGLMYYRKDLIAELPNSEGIERKLKDSITWKEFIKLGEMFMPEKNPLYLFPADNFEGLVCSFIEILLYKNPEFFTSGRIDWQSKEIRNSMQFLFDLIHTYKITPLDVTEFKDNSSYNYYVNNDGVFLRGWPSFMKDYKNLLRSEKIDTLLESAALPHFENTQSHSVIGGWNIMLSKFSENKEEAVEFIKFLLREESQKTLYKYGAYLPVLSSIYLDEEFLKVYPELEYNKQLLDKGVHRPFLENYTKISDVVSFYTKQVLKGSLKIDDALIRVQQALESGELIVR